MTFQDAFKNLEILEGGFTVDDGGPTKYGITQNAWNAYCDDRSVPHSPVHLINLEDASNFYADCYWNPLCCNDLPNGVDFALFQWAINHEYMGNEGPAVKDLQRCVGATPDGVMGPETIKSVKSKDPNQVIECLLTRQLHWYFRDAKVNADAPLIGWENRVDRVKKILGLVHGD